ncbi:hypothetical protein UlMin_033714 [Ulmus minor]
MCLCLSNSWSFLQTLMGSLHLRNQVAAQERRMADLTASNVQLRKVLADARAHEGELGVPWTEEKHKLFQRGLQMVRKGDWRGISRNFVKTRTPTQVASHAQKYFLRRNSFSRRCRRSSLFDITTETETLQKKIIHILLCNNSKSEALPPVVTRMLQSGDWPCPSTHQ